MQRLLSLFIAFVLLVVPMGMIGGVADAHAGATYANMEASSCHETQPAPDEKSKGVGMSAECALACAALPSMPVRVEARVAVTPLVHPIIAPRAFAEAGPESLDPPPRA